MRRADLAVERRRDVLWLRGWEVLGEGKLGVSRGLLGTGWDAVECIDEAEVEWKCRMGVGLWIGRLGLETAAMLVGV